MELETMTNPMKLKLKIWREKIRVKKINKKINAVNHEYQ